MNKKGWTRIAEAGIAIVLIAGVVLILLNNKVFISNNGGDIKDAEISILRKIQLNETTRGKILNVNTLPLEWNNFPVELNKTITENLQNYIVCESKICSISDSCGFNRDIHRSIYVHSVIIAANTSKYNPRQIKLFCWEK